MLDMFALIVLLVLCAVAIWLVALVGNIPDLQVQRLAGTMSRIPIDPEQDGPLPRI